jgi:hypothetical protein
LPGFPRTSIKDHPGIRKNATSSSSSHVSEKFDQYLVTAFMHWKKNSTSALSCNLMAIRMQLKQTKQKQKRKHTNKQNKTQDKTKKPNLDHSSCVSQAVSCNIISEHQRLHGLLISCSEFFFLRQYSTHLISLFFLLSIVFNNQPIPQAKRNFTKEKKTKKLATKLTEPALSNLTSSSKTTTKKKKKTNKQKNKKKKEKKRAHTRTYTHIHTNQNNRAKQANKTNSGSDAQKLINQAPDATTNRQVPKTKATYPPSPSA